MNESRSSRYHRAKRRAGATAVIAAALPLALFLLPPFQPRLRDLAGDSPAAWMLLLAAAQGLAVLPATWYRGFHLEREYALSSSTAAAWLRDYLKAWLLGAVVAAIAAEGVYLAMRLSPAWWWAIAAAGGATLLAALTALAPVVLLPLFYQTRPLDRPSLHRRLLDLSARAGVRVLAVHEIGLGAKSRRANAALVGAGITRRILLSDSLLAEYSEDEIEVVLAHELGHHRHRDVLKGLLVESVVMLGSLAAAAMALRVLWARMQLTSATDPAGLPLLLMTAGAVSLAATPLLNAWSRRNERRADRVALDLTERPEAFIAVIRRMAAQNLAEEHPPRVARWLLNTHPTVDARIGQARRFSEARRLAAAQAARAARGPSSARERRSSAEPAGV